LVAKNAGAEITWVRRPLESGADRVAVGNLLKALQALGLLALDRVELSLSRSSRGAARMDRLVDDVRPPCAHSEWLARATPAAAARGQSD
jgi:hypothetical protein